MTLPNLLLRATIAFLGFLMFAATPVVAFVNLTPHRAIYDLTLKSAKKRSGIKDLEGRMVIEVTGSACEGWSVNFRLVNDFQLPAGKRRLIDSRSTSWESGDGLQMSFLEREFVDNKPLQVTRLKADKKLGTVQQKSPKRKKFDIPKATIFPIQHQQRLIEKARQGQIRDKSVVYDGADHDNLYEAITFIGKKRIKPAKQKTVKGDGGSELLNKSISWPVSVSYYTLNKKRRQDTPSQQISFLMYENGIAGDLIIDYGDFALNGKLTRLDVLPQSKCK